MNTHVLLALTYAFHHSVGVFSLNSPTPENPPRHAQKLVSKAILDPARLTTNLKQIFLPASGAQG